MGAGLARHGVHERGGQPGSPHGGVDVHLGQLADDLSPGRPHAGGTGVDPVGLFPVGVGLLAQHRGVADQDRSGARARWRPVGGFLYR